MFHYFPLNYKEIKDYLKCSNIFPSHYASIEIIPKNRHNFETKPAKCIAHRSPKYKTFVCYPK